VSLSKDELVAVMAYVDGQLDDEETREVLGLLAKSEDARIAAAELGAVGEWVRTSCDDRAVAGKADRIVASVMREAEQLGGGNVISLERARARRVLNRQRIMEFGALAAVAAVVFLLWAWPRGEPRHMVASGAPSYASPMPRPPAKNPEAVAHNVDPNMNMVDGVNPRNVTPEAPAESGTPLAVGSEHGVDIENVESPHPVSVFYLPLTDKNAASIVVWIGEPEEVH
jgi:anti-sigma factor RsiW